MAKDPATNLDRFAMQEHAANSLVFVARSAIVAVSTLASALLGISAQQFLGPSYVAEARSMTNSVVGLVATLLAVVVGLLVSTSYGLFNSQQTDLETIVRSVARMRFVLRHFGPEAEEASAILRKQILQLKARLWPSDGGGQARKITHEGVHVDIHEMLAALDELRPANDEQRHALGQAREIFGKFIETQGSMIRSLASRVPNLFLNVVMGWACALFFGYGILAGANLLTLLMAALGSVAIASAIFLILEMSDPYTGLFRVSSAVLERLPERPTAPAELTLMLPTRIASARGSQSFELISQHELRSDGMANLTDKVAVVTGGCEGHRRSDRQGAGGRGGGGRRQLRRQQGGRGAGRRRHQGQRRAGDRRPGGRLESGGCKPALRRGESSVWGDRHPGEQRRRRPNEPARGGDRGSRSTSGRRCRAS